MIPSDVGVLPLDHDGPSLRVYDDSAGTAMELTRLSARDAKNYTAFHSSFEQRGRALAPVLSMTPPDVDDLSAVDYLNLGKLGLNFRSLDKKDKYRLLRWGPMAVADLVTEWFETDLLRATIAARGIFGASAGPWSAGTSVGLLLQAAMDGQATAPGSAPKGGIGAITEALANASVMEIGRAHV